MGAASGSSRQLRKMLDGDIRDCLLKVSLAIALAAMSSTLSAEDEDVCTLSIECI